MTEAEARTDNRSTIKPGHWESLLRVAGEANHSRKSEADLKKYGVIVKSLRR